MTAFVVALQVQGRRCVVVGGGGEARDKCEKLLAAGASVTVVAPTLDPQLRARVESGQISHVPHEFDPSRDLSPPPFVVVSTAALAADHARVLDPSRRVGALVCCVDSPDQCDFFHTALGACGPLTLAVASGGTAPLLARSLRDQLVRQLDAPLRGFADALVALRASTPAERRREVLSRAMQGFSLAVSVSLPEWVSRPRGES